MKVELSLDDLARLIRDASQTRGEHFIYGCAIAAVEAVGFSVQQDEQIRDTLMMHGRFLGVLDG